MRGSEDRGMRWLVCCGAATFLDVARELVACGCTRGIDWEPTAARVLGRLSQAGPAAVNVLAGPGCEGSDARSVAYAAASSQGASMVVLVSEDAGAVVGEAIDRGVDVTVTPRGLGRVLRGLRESRGQGVCDGDARRDALASLGDEGADAAPRAPAVQEGAPGVRAGGVRASGRLPREGVVETLGSLGFAREMSARLPVLDDEPVPFEVDEPEASRGPAGEARLGRDCEVRAPGGGGEGPAPVASMRPDTPGTRLIDAHAATSDVEVVEVRPCPVVVLPQADEARAPVVCLASARGGVGKSALAACMALTMARDGLRVALLDLDYQFGTCLGFLGGGETDGLPVPTPGAAPLVIDERVLARCRVQIQEGLVAYEFCHLPEQAEVLVPWTGRLVDAARVSADVVVADLPTGVGEGQLEAFERADRCLLVGDERALSLESLSAACALCVRAGVPRTKLVSVLNRLDAKHRDEGFIARAGFELQTPQVMKVVDGGDEVGSMLSMGCAGELLAVRNRFALSVADLARALCADLGCQPGVPAGAPWGAQGSPEPRRRGKRSARRELVACP